MRIYTLEEAQAVLPGVIPVLESLCAAYRELKGIQAAVAADSRGATADGALTANPFDDKGINRMEELNKRLRTEAARLDRWGIELKDPERGLIDFNWEREGEVVYLCYLLGETEIAWWHRREDGFAGRRPL